MNEPRVLDVRIMGRVFSLSCTEEESDTLIAAVKLIDQRMSEVHETGKVAGFERIAVMAALNIAYEYINLRKGRLDVGDLKRRVNDMGEQIDEVLIGQDHLF